MSFPRYPSYKESGVEWLGKVPKHWDVGSVRWLTSRYSGGTPDKTNFAYWEDGTIPWLNSGAVNDRLISEASTYITADAFANSSAKWIPEGALVMALAGQGKTKGMVAQLAIPTTCNQSMAAIVPSSKIKARFLFWWLDSNYQNIRNMAGGDLRDGLNLELLPITEQTNIAAFLDHETAKIDALVAEQRRLMELLKEKRQAVISHAVTKGLNPRAPIKPSGIEWLGDVPRHWNVCLLKRAFRSVDYGISESLDSEGAVAILRMGNIANGKVVTDDLKYTDAVDPYLLLKTGDLLYNRTNSLDLIGKVGMFIEKGEAPVSFASYLVRLRTVEESLPDYFAYLLNTEGILGLARSNAFVAIGQCNLNPTRYGQITIAIPPRAEQATIVDYLNIELAKLDTLTAEAQHAINLLQERRTALISGAVTGQIDVRGVVASSAVSPKATRV